ncbi:MAG: sodium:calcium antiporter, partial [bacterium]|nr:sodium:calcium antiporter [bacterium]
KESTIINPAEDKPQYRRSGLSVFLILIGLTALLFGGKWIVDSAVVIARSLGVSEGLIGLTIVAVGTSLPELATSIKASWDRKNDIAIGNIVGSNIFNVFFILGTTAVIKPIPVPSSFIFDIAVVVVATLALFAIMFTGKKNHVIGRVEGLLFVLGYTWYVWYSIQR